MRIVKYMVSILLIAFAALAIAEGYAQYTFSFSTNYQGVVVKETTESNIEHLAEQYDVDFFCEEYRFDDIFTHRVNLYCSEGMESVLRHQSMIQEGTYKSLLFGDTIISIFPFKEFEPNKNAVEYYVYGTHSNLLKFCEESGGNPFRIEGAMGNTNQYTVYWLIVLGTTIILTLYEIALLRKEVILRMVSGQDLRVFVLRHAIKEFVFYCVLFLLLCLLFSILSSLPYYLKNAAVWIFLIAMINGLLYILLLFTDYKRDIHTGVRAQRVLKISYVYKIIGIVLTLVVIAGCVQTIVEAVPFYWQKEVFSHYKNYSYYQMNVDIDNDDVARADRLTSKLYKEYLEKKKTFTMVELQDPASYDTNYIYADAGALPYLCREIPELSKLDWEEQAVYRILPTEYEKTGNKQGDASKEAFETYYEGPYQMKSVYYEGDVKLLACDGSVSDIGVGTTELKKNPVIILNLITRDVGTIDPYILQSAMVEITDAEWNTFAEENGISKEPIYKTNAWENYSIQWNVKKGSIIFCAALILCILLIEGILLYQILKYEFYVHAQELLLKKLHGYQFWQRYRKLLALTLICTIMGGGGVVLFSYCYFRELFGAMVAASVAVLLIETALLTLLIRKMENRNIQRILKGGLL